jgi:DNA-binding NtrC family response regulator
MSEGMQKKLLRVLEEGRLRPVGSTRELGTDVRLIAASNRSLKQLVADKAFREDLYYRLKAFSLTMPTLRERPDDIPMLVAHALGQIAQEMKQPPKPIDPEAVKLLMKAPWPGNVRELKNELRRLAVVSGARITAADVPAHVRDYEQVTTGLLSPGKYQEKMAAFEKQLIQTALAQSDGQIRPAARILGIDRNTLKSKLKKYGLTAAEGD